MLKGLSGVPFVAALGAVAGARQVWLSNEERDLVEALSMLHRRRAWTALCVEGEVCCRERLGGLLGHYYRAA